MSTTTSTKTAIPEKLDARIPVRILEEGYGLGAWHGSDLRAALDEVPAALAFRRVAKGRHNIAEIALHHAYCARSVRGQISGLAPEAFVVEGDDWFALSERGPLSWTEVKEALEGQQRRLAAVVADVGAGRVKSPLSEADRFDLVLGITCHAIYHAGQVQLLKKLHAE